MRTFLWIFFILAGLVEGALTAKIFFQSRKSVVSPPAVVKKESLPQELYIPGLKLTARVEAVGLGPDGEMAMPENSETVAWYKLGAKLGEKGSTVIAGHLDSETGPAIFWRLSSLKVGDEIFVFDQDGREFRFEVTQTETYPEDQFPLEAVFAQDDKVHLNLITCKGYFNRTTRRYNKRIVVYSELKERETSPAPAETTP